MFEAIANAYADDQLARSLKERFARELGRLIGTDADPVFWARNFGCDPIAATAVIEQLKRERRAVERDGRLYSI